METFFNVLRNEIRYEENNKKLLPYYATLKQVKELDGFKEMIDDIKNKDYEITYIEESENDWYSDGKFIIYFNDEYGYEYVIHLKDDTRDWGYCDCTPEMEGYDHTRGCCGNGCDYTFPKIEIEKVIRQVSHAYDGIAKQLWNDLEEIEVELSGDKKKVEELRREQQRKALQEQIDSLHRRLEELK